VQGDSAAVSNGFVCVATRGGSVWHASADFDGTGAYGANVMAAAGLTLQREDGDGKVHSSAGASVLVRVLRNDSRSVSISILGVTDGPAASALVLEDWTLSLEAGSRAAEFSANGSIIRAGSARGVRRQWEMTPAAVYGLFGRGVVQMKAALPGYDFYPTRDALRRVYGLGAAGSELGQVGNASFDIMPSSGPAETVLMSSTSGVPFWSGLQQVLAAGFAAGGAQLDTWMLGWHGLAASPVTLGPGWNHSLRLGVNSLDFPVATLPGPEELSMPRDDIHALLMGVYASPVGALCTHDNEVEAGTRVAQIATTIARPDRGYSGTYNFFDPDNYISTSAMLLLGDPYVSGQVRAVLERSGAFLTAEGQLPHHFDGTKPVYQALSGEIQTGPNVFWILSCINYAESAQDLDWLRGYMPTLRLASSFLFDLIDEDVGMASVPGSLMIDVFIRNNFTSDTNAQLVGFFRRFAAAEDAVANATGAAALRKIADRIVASMNEHLWATPAAGGDHFVTQWDGPVLGTTRDFVDYDANLMATAHGVPAGDRAALILKRIDGGRCRPSATFVSEKWYGPGDTTHGNVGDSWTAMGRIAWFDALTRQRYGDAAGLERLVLGPLRSALLSTTWMHERLSCAGEQQLNRTAMYFEYPSTVAMILRSVKYGIAFDFQTVTVRPLGPTQFAYSLGNVAVAFGPRSVTVTLPGEGDRTYSVGPVAPGERFRITVSGDGAACAAPRGPATSTADGILSFVAPVGCTVSAAA